MYYKVALKSSSQFSWVISWRKKMSQLRAVFPHIVSGETIIFLNLDIVVNSNSCRNISFFHLINWIFAAETIQGRKLFKSGNYMRKYGNYSCILRQMFFRILKSKMQILNLVYEWVHYKYGCKTPKINLTPNVFYLIAQVI